MKSKRFSPEEDQAIRHFYKGGFKGGDGSLSALAARLDRPVHSICRRARTMGLTDQRRQSADSLRDAMSDRARAWIAERGHPRGMAGKSHSEATKETIGRKSAAAWDSMTDEEKRDHVLRALKTKSRRGNLALPRAGVTWKQGWRQIGEQRCFFRSRWEANYARYLEVLRVGGDILSWEHEAETFWFEEVMRGVRCYIPDYRVTFPDGRVEYHEVKGWMDARSATKLKRMRKYYPGVTVVLRDAAWFKANPRLRDLIPEWE